jgi:gamma-glutamyltranspeptidase / glutathione hydrolase
MWPAPLQDGWWRVSNMLENGRGKALNAEYPMRAFVFFFLICLSASAAEPVRAEKGMVVSSHHLASQAGADVLKAGGNAIDAAIATGMALAVVHPSAGNIGGGGFMVVLTKDGEATSFDFREKAPAAAHEKMFLDERGQYIKDSNHEGYRAVGVPGTVAGFDLALKRLGTKSWAELTAAAIRLATNGFGLSLSQAKAFARLKADWQKYPPSSKVFLNEEGTTTWGAGQRWRQADLGRTLQRIAENGRDGFYAGVTARMIASDMKRNGGLITEADLAAYKAVERKPIEGTYRGYQIFSMPPPSSGGVALVEMLNILETTDLKSLGHNSASYLHLLAESMRRAYADRARFLGDPDFHSSMPVARLLGKDYARRLALTIEANRASPSEPEQFGSIYEPTETTHYSVMDAEGNAVVVTYTLEYSYGSRIVADGLGFLYNNEMGDFNPQPGRTDETGLIGTPPNVVAPGKRMLSSMTPTIVAKDGKPYLLIGTPGGRTIINTVLQVVLNVLDHDLSVADAIAAPRIHHQWLPNRITYESKAVSRDTKQTLETYGHKLLATDHIGEAMGILVEPKTGARLGAADPRSADGKAIGY